MNKLSWSADDRAEFDALVTEALAESEVAVRIDVFVDGLDDAEQAQRHWARDVLHHFRRNGANALLKSEQQLRRPRVPVTHDGMVIGRMPREAGLKTRDDEGKVVHQRGLFEYLTWDELRAKIDEFSRMRRSLDVDIIAIRKLLTLESMVPEASNPAEACDQLGTTVERFLSEERAA